MSVEAANAFISRWAKASPSERANSQFFLSELCDVLAKRFACAKVADISEILETLCVS
jgi:hypothetical protein